jgi:hypothetical protein|tara:strand:+ start:483 stop:794 length:312 start_codon:yes stop_codon:yes gene_type:complete
MKKGNNDMTDIELKRWVMVEAEQKLVFNREITRRVMNLNEDDSVHMMAEMFFQDIGTIYDIIKHMPRFARDTYLIQQIESEEQWEDLMEWTVEAQTPNRMRRL